MILRSPTYWFFNSFDQNLFIEPAMYLIFFYDLVVNLGEVEYLRSLLSSEG